MTTYPRNPLGDNLRILWNSLVHNRKFNRGAAWGAMIIGALLVELIYQLISLTRLLRDDVKPLVESTQATLNTVKGTASFVSQRVTQPAVAAAGYVAGVGRSFSVLVGMLPRRRPSAREKPNHGEEAAQPEEADKGG